MNFLDWHELANPDSLTSGKLLIAQPFLADSTFSRSVVFLCEHGEQGSLGFVLNQPTTVNIGELLPELYSPGLHINHGGPVQLDTLHILHRSPEIIGGTEVNKGVYWGGSFDALQARTADGSLTGTDVRLFVGYSGWSSGQLERELTEGSWLIGDVSLNVIFDTKAEDVWKAAILSLGNDYKYLINLPVNPVLN